MKKYGLLLCALLVGVVGCGGDDSPTNSAPPTGGTDHVFRIETQSQMTWTIGWTPFEVNQAEREPALSWSFEGKGNDEIRFSRPDGQYLAVSFYASYVSGQDARLFVDGTLVAPCFSNNSSRYFRLDEQGVHPLPECGTQ